MGHSIEHKWLRQSTQKAASMLALLLITCVIAIIMGCPRQESHGGKPERLVAASLPWPGATPLYVAIEKGFFKDAGLDFRLKYVPTGKIGIDAVLSGQVDCAGAADTPIARAVVDGKPVSVIVTIADVQQAIAIISKKQNRIARPEDLKGKSIGVTFGAGAEFFLHLYLVTYQIKPAEVRIVNIPPDRIVDALVDGKVQAVCTWSPYKLILQEKLGPDAVVLSDPSLYLQTFNLVAAKQFVKGNPARTQKLLRALVRANAFIQEHPSETRRIMSKYLGTAGELYQREWDDYVFTATLDQGLLLNLEDQGRWMLREAKGASRKAPNFLDHIDVTLLKAVQPDAVRIIGR